MPRSSIIFECETKLTIIDSHALTRKASILLGCLSNEINGDPGGLLNAAAGTGFAPSRRTAVGNGEALDNANPARTSLYPRYVGVT